MQEGMWEDQRICLLNWKYSTSWYLIFCVSSKVRFSCLWKTPLILPLTLFISERVQFLTLSPLLPCTDRATSHPAPAPAGILKQKRWWQGKQNIGKDICGNPLKNYWKYLIRRRKLGHIFPISYSSFQIKYLF